MTDIEPCTCGNVPALIRMTGWYMVRCSYCEKHSGNKKSALHAIESWNKIITNELKGETQND